MLIRCGYDIRYETDVPTPLMAMLSVHPTRHKDLVTTHRIVASPDVPMYDYMDAFGNVCTRVTVPAGGLTLSCDFTVEDDGQPDRLSDTAWSLFGHIAPGWERVQAIVEFTHNHIEFGYHHARPTKTAWDSYQERQGVCRDYAHLAVTLCRCMNIPARYCTGYLGDIGMPPPYAAGDFSAWFDVYLSGEWHTFDARHNMPRIGRVLMARGRDATDTALTTTFGPAQLVGFNVVTDEVTA